MHSWTQAFAFLVLAPLAARGQEAKLTAPDAGTFDRFGTTVVLEGGLAFVGSPTGDGAVPDSGTVYVLDATPGSPTFGQEEIRLSAADGELFDRFGETLALDAGLVLVGAIADDDVADSAGSAYLFDADPASPTFGQQLEKLTASNPSFNVLFGLDVALADGLALVGARGDAYLFDADSASPTFGQELQLLVPSGPGFDFGSACALGGGLALVGDPTDDAGGAVAGTVYVFDADPASPTFGTELTVLGGTVAGPDDFFGNAVAVADGLALIGAKNDNAYGEAAGTAHLFDVDLQSPGFGDHLIHFYAPELFDYVQFGTAVALGGGRAVVGAPLQTNGLAFTGAAYVFDADTASPTFGQLLETFTAADGSDSDNLGHSVAVSGQLVCAGAPQDDDSGSSSGSAYLFPLGDAPVAYCTPKTSSAGCSARIATSNFAAQPVSGASDYSVTAAGVGELKNGLLFAGISGPAALPFSGGTLCVQPPTKRGPIMGSGGDDPTECDGSYGTLVNDGQVIPAGLDAGSGNSGWYQYWYRDPQGGAGQLGTALSNAVQLDYQ